MQTRYNLLLVDDEPSNLGVLTSFLNEKGYLLRIALDGTKAIQLAEESTPDIILLDIMMHGIDGFSVCRQLKRKPELKQVPIIFITALNDTASKVKAFQSGAVDFITKPFQQEEVIARIETHITIKVQKEELEAQRNELEKLNATKDRFFSIIAHDLRSPLASIKMYLDSNILSTKETDDINSRIIGEMRGVINKTLELTENLLSWAMIQKGEMPYKPSTCNLFTLTEACIAPIEIMARQKSIEIINKINREDTAWIDRDMILTVLRNLISNSIKFSNPSGQIEILSEKPENEPSLIKITVKDNGVGIKKEIAAKLFRIETKFSTAGTAKEKGSGLGLILCKELVEKNNGTISIESEFGKGTAISFTLPIENTTH